MKLKTLFVLITALLFNVIGAQAMSFASGLPFAAIFGGGALLSLFGGAASGHVNMAIQKEIWMSTIVEGLFADNSFLSKAINADEFVNMGKVVHIPNAGAASKTEKNRTTLPATVKKRTDKDLTFNLDEYTTDPVLISHAETVELSYNKRESVIRQDRSKLHEDVANGILFSWSPAKANTILTTGEAIAAHTDAATGERKALTKKDVNNVMKRFNKDDVPQEGRYLLLDADMYSQLLDSMTEKEADAFHNLADLKNGVIGKLYTFNVIMRSKALRYTGATAPKDWETAGAATDCAAALAWHQDSVCRALGEVAAFENEKDATFYGDVYSFLLRAGGRPMRDDMKGLLAIVQDTAQAAG
ncbi:P22 phage major capsid protein family protein [Dysgonomonas sp. Marseille-P4361]|uniref:P22 phage major capsid protein family protein n=1 Tax=Dysgonomonas sp. Marseille-P4361 TaxID=2161820 RepID=UPI0021011052|nr:P22 phage major capsid protein family protein [Dysgonomonas sp. Marseille-P4361]